MGATAATHEISRRLLMTLLTVPTEVSRTRVASRARGPASVPFRLFPAPSLSILDDELQSEFTVAVGASKPSLLPLQ